MGGLVTDLLAATAAVEVRRNEFAYTGENPSLSWEEYGSLLAVGLIMSPVAFLIGWLFHKWRMERFLVLNALFAAICALTLFLAIRFFNLTRNADASLQIAWELLISDELQFRLAMASIVAFSFVAALSFGWFLKSRARKRLTTAHEVFE